MKLEKSEKIGLYRLMYKIRAFEQQCVALSHKGLIRGPLHSYLGEEAIAAGSISVLEKDDYITSTHRGHGHCIARGADVGRMFAELLGKETGYCRGRGGSMHIADVKLGILGANGIVGAGIPIATGAGLAARHKARNGVVLCFFGDGAINTGAFHEGVNLAAAWKLPVVFICENNLYAITMPINKACLLHSVADRAKGYGIPGICLDGNDVLAVHEVATEAVEHARRGEGPTLLECQTYRWLGHHLADDGKYRPEEEVRYWREQRDPIKVFSNRLVEKEVVSDEELHQINEGVDIEIQSGVQYAMESEPAKAETVLEDIYYT
jgi:TPP-dependent pyruvate/acetoin dehydrogenase alpha subunit